MILCWRMRLATRPLTQPPPCSQPPSNKAKCSSLPSTSFDLMRVFLNRWTDGHGWTYICSCLCELVNAAGGNPPQNVMPLRTVISRCLDRCHQGRFSFRIVFFFETALRRHLEDNEIHKHGVGIVFCGTGFWRHWGANYEKNLFRVSNFGRLFSRSPCEENYNKEISRTTKVRDVVQLSSKTLVGGTTNRTHVRFPVLLT